MRSSACPAFAAAFLSVTFPALAQTVPEGVHTDAEGPATMCGLTAHNAVGLAALVRAAPNLRPETVKSERFELFAAPDQLTQWAITKPSQAAYPAVTCRSVYTENGSIMMKRDMRCDADRKACDALFLEFQELDRKAANAVREAAG